MSFRPVKRPNSAILDGHRPLLQSLERRGLIRGGLSLGALSLLTGCDMTRPQSVEEALLAISRIKPVDGANWRLELAGLIAEKRPWTLSQINALPQQSEIIKHICVEGWDYIGQWSGVLLRTFLERVGADLNAKYVVFKTADDYPSSIDMATALHPQTLLATQYANATLADPFGYPLRLRMSTKLGYKNPKWITAIEVTNTYQDGYWEKLGFPWFAGL
jgi:DMSO/TMAO reductase YedYZ molybdopterin-dependent catalytic subunit